MIKNQFMEKKVTSPAVKGVIISLLLIVLSLIIQFLNLAKNRGFSSLQFIILMGGLIWSAVSFSKQMNANVTFGNLFTHAFKTAAAVTAIMVIYSIISIKFINPEIIDTALREARAGMEGKNMSDDQVDQALAFTRKFFIPLTAGGILLSFLIMGVIGALIGAAVSKKNPQQGPFVQQG
jgi:hypothetical protein